MCLWNWACNGPLSFVHRPSPDAAAVDMDQR
jgi:hypothetical protein